ncbi:MAG: hypothetical protein H0W73_18710 [Bacteroidetes bacterium]|nr:hypothetical protein [Bacteroidota bacterium]
MKTSKFTSVILTVVALVFCINTSNAKTNPITQNSSTCLKINGIILKAPHKAERGSYKVELLKDNVVIDSSKVSVNKEFEFVLSKNSWYTIRVTKEGHVPLLLSIDTKIDAQNALIYEFQFETELLDSKTVNAGNDIMDFPIGVVKFDKVNNRFYPVENYTADIKQKILDPTKSKYSESYQSNNSMMATQDDDDMIVK